MNNENLECHLSRRGYTIIKTSLHEDEEEREKIIKKLREELTVSPRVLSNFPVKVKPYPVFKENFRKIYLPRFYGVKHIGHLSQDKTHFSEATRWANNIQFQGELRDKQKEPIKKTLVELRQNGGAILCLLAGGGKTVCALKK